MAPYFVQMSLDFVQVMECLGKSRKKHLPDTLYAAIDPLVEHKVPFPYRSEPSE